MVDEDLRELERKARTGSAVDTERFLQALLRSGKANETLGALVEEWRACRAPELARAADRLSSRLDHERIEGTSRRKLHERWLREARSATVEKLGALLPLLSEGTYAQIAEKVAAAAQWPADPRTVTALLEFVRRTKRCTPSSEEAWNAVLARLEAFGDPRALDDLGKLEPSRTWSALEERFRGSVTRVRNALAARTPGSPRPEALGLARALLDLGEAPAREASTIALAEVLEAPSDLEKRVVFGRTLPEDDPRRELIELQDRARHEELDERGHARIRKLIEDHGPLWSGMPQRALVRSALDFQLGFVSRLRLVGPVDPVPECATIRELAIPSDEAWVRRFLLSPHVKSLSTLVCESRRAIAAIAPTSKIEALQFVGVPEVPRPRWYEAQRDPDDLVVELEKLSCLRRLSFTGDPEGHGEPHPDGWFQRIFEGPLLSRLEHLEVGGIESEHEAWFRALEPLSVATFSTWPSADRTWMRPPPWTFTFSRRASGTFSRLRARTIYWNPRPLVELLNELPAGRLEELEVVAADPDASFQEEVLAAARRHSRLAPARFFFGGRHGR